MKKSLFLGLILLTTDLWSQCNILSGGKLVKIPQGKSTSLFEKGKALENYKTQDQDGLNSCYANTTSSILKTVLKGHPDISYTHVAVKASGYDPKYDKEAIKYVNDDGSPFSDSGNICQAFNVIQKEGACPKAESVLERYDSIEPENQKKLFQGLGKYLDLVNNLKNEPTKLAELNKEVILAASSLKTHQAALMSKCIEYKLQKFPLKEAVSDILNQGLLESDDECTKARKEAIKKLLPDSVIASDRTNIIPSEALIEEVTKALEEDPAVAADIDSFLKDRKHDKKSLAAKGLKSDKITNAVWPKLQKVFMKLSPNENLAGKCNDVEKDQSALFSKKVSKVSFLNKIDATKNYSACKDSEEDIKNAARKDANLACIAPTRLDQLMEALLPLLKIGVAIDERTISALNNPVTHHADQLEKLLMPQCSDKSALLPVDQDLSCNVSAMCNVTLSAKQEPFRAQILDPATNCYKPAAAAAVFQGNVLTGLNEGKAVGITVCRDFLDATVSSPDYCKNQREGKELGQNHSMTISGYRCHNNKIQYEILNSWGKQCPEADDGINIICDDKTGRFWVNQETIVGNTMSVSHIEKKSAPAAGSK